MKTAVAENSIRIHASSLILAMAVAIGGILGCGGNGEGHRSGAVMAKADAVEVTYYYLPG